MTIRCDCNGVPVSKENRGSPGGASRLVGVEHASFEASRYAANMGPSVRHRTQLAFGIAHRLPFQAPPQMQPPAVSSAAPGISFFIDNLAEEGCSSRARCPSTQTGNPARALCALPYRLPPPASLCFDGSSDTTEEHGPLGVMHDGVSPGPRFKSSCFIYIWSQA